MQAIKALLMTGAIVFTIMMTVSLFMLLLPFMVISGGVAIIFLLIYQYLKINK